MSVRLTDDTLYELVGFNHTQVVPVEFLTLSAMELFFMSGLPFCLQLPCVQGDTITCMCTQVTRYTVLPIVSHYSTDLQVAVMHHGTQQCTNKGRKEEGKPVNMDVKNAGFANVL